MKRAAFSFTVNLETKDPTIVEIPIPILFRPDRLWLEMPPWPFWLKLRDYAIHVPRTFVKTILVALRMQFSRRTEPDPELAEQYPEYALEPPSPWPSWKPPRPGPPVMITNINVGKTNVVQGSVPSSLFNKDANFQLPSPTISPCSKITLTVLRTCDEPYVLRGCFLGATVE